MKWTITILTLLIFFGLPLSSSAEDLSRGQKILGSIYNAGQSLLDLKKSFVRGMDDISYRTSKGYQNAVDRLSQWKDELAENIHRAGVKKKAQDLLKDFRPKVALARECRMKHTGDGSSAHLEVSCLIQGKTEQTVLSWGTSRGSERFEMHVFDELKTSVFQSLASTGLTEGGSMCEDDSSKRRYAFHEGIDSCIGFARNQTNAALVAHPADNRSTVGIRN